MATVRFLSKIHSLLDDEEFKQAHNTCETAYERTQELIFEALRALALFKLGRKRDAYDLCSVVKAESPTDKDTVLLLTDVLKSLGRGDENIDLLENSFAQRADEKVGQELMTCYVRQFKYSKQYYLALKLYKAFTRLHYALWTVQSVCLLAHHDPSQSSVLDIGDLLLQRIKRKPEFRYTALILRLDLQMQTLLGNYYKAVRMLEEFGQLLPTVEERHYILAELMRRSGKSFDQLNAYHGVLCRKDPGPVVDEMEIVDAALRMDI
jgi:tetratricopeptide (TPR) repeat protein